MHAYVHTYMFIPVERTYISMYGFNTDQLPKK
jgi:hypothetical protein